MLHNNYLTTFINFKNFNKMKKKKINGQLINTIKNKFQKKEKISMNILEENDTPNKLKVNLCPNLKNNAKKKPKNEVILRKNLYNKIISNNLQKYNASPKEKNIMTINNLIKCKSCHFLAKFKDCLISDYVDEFLRRKYSKKESIERLPKIYNYYKNYLKFFCKPTFIISFANEIIKNYGDLNAEYFYKNNLEKKSSKNKGKILDQKINEDNNNKENDFSLENQFKPIGKTVFTKSIKNSIDNAYVDDFSLSEKKAKKYNQNESESIVKIFGNDEDENNVYSNNNSLFLMINEIKDNKNEQNRKKYEIKEKTIKMNKNNNNNRYTFIETSPNVLSNNIKKRNKNIKKNLSNFEKANTYMNNFHIEPLKNMVYSPKSKKKGVFFLKKDNNNNLERYLSPITGIANTDRVEKNQNSIIVNINININTNQEQLNNNINTNKNILSNNLVYKSPTHNISKSKKIFYFSPIATSMYNNYNNDKPLLSARNQESKKLNYIKIIKRPNNYNNTNRNRRNNETIEAKNLTSLESLEFNKNYSCNKDNNRLLYNKQILKNKNKEKEENNKKLIVNKNELYATKINTSNINKNLYFSPNKLAKSQKLVNPNKIDTNNKKYIYQKKSNNIITSPINKNIKSNKKFFQTKKV